jgi:hypothetical protein
MDPDVCCSSCGDAELETSLFCSRVVVGFGEGAEIAEVAGGGLRRPAVALEDLDGV